MMSGLDSLRAFESHLQVCNKNINCVRHQAIRYKMAIELSKREI